MAVCSMPKPEAFKKLSQEKFVHLNLQHSLARKIILMEDMLSLSDSEIYEKEKIVADIIDLLKPYYPYCDVLVYGSSCNGFGFKGCDLDLLFLPFPEYCNLDFKDKGNGIIPSPYYILKGTIPRNVLFYMEEEMHLKFIQRIMYTTKRYFKKVLFIPAKCPILNIEFVDSPITCDLSSSNRLVVYNSQLLWLFGKLDHRVRPLVMLLRYWAKSLGFIAKSRLSSYCFTLMVMFYLQNTDPPVLPSVACLIELSGYSRIIDGWETAICTDLDCINADRYDNMASVSELLIGFFDFFWKFDFVKNIVNPHSGTPYPVEKVTESKDERIKNFQVTSFSIQDPFILSRNLSRNATMKTSFKLSLMIAKKLLLKGNFKFQSLFDLNYYNREMSAIFLPTKSKLSTNSIFFTLQLTYNLCYKLGITTELNPWFEKVGQIVYDVLHYGLLLECEIIDKVVPNNEMEHPAKKRKVDPDDIGNLKLIVSIQCIVNFPTIWKRKRTEIHIDDTTDDDQGDDDEEIPVSLKKEYKISKKLAKSVQPDSANPSNEVQSPILSFICNCFQYSDAQLSDIVVSFSALTDTKVFSGAKDYLKAFVYKHVKKILEDT